VLEEGHHELRAAKTARFKAWTEARRVATAAAAAAAEAEAAAAATAAAAAAAAAKRRADAHASTTPGTTAMAAQAHRASISGAAAKEPSNSAAYDFLTPSKWAIGNLSFAAPRTSAKGGTRARKGLWGVIAELARLS
jgi:hypothetical protein